MFKARGGARFDRSALFTSTVVWNIQIAPVVADLPSYHNGPSPHAKMLSTYGFRAVLFAYTASCIFPVIDLLRISRPPNKVGGDGDGADEGARSCAYNDEIS